MAKISLKLDDYVNSEGKSLLKAVLSHNSRTVTLKEITHVKPRDWDAKRKQIKSSSGDFTKNEIFVIYDKIDDYRRVLRDIALNENINKYSVKEIRTKLLKELEGDDQESNIINVSLAPLKILSIVEALEYSILIARMYKRFLLCGAPTSSAENIPASVL